MRARTRAGLVFGAVISLLMAGASMQAPPSSAATVSGTLVVVPKHQSGTQHGGNLYWVAKPSGQWVRVVDKVTTRSAASSTKRVGFRRTLQKSAGQRVTVSGPRKGKRLYARSVTSRPSQAKAAVAAGPRKTAVLIGDFGSGASISVANARKAMFTGVESARSYYEEVTNDGIRFRGKTNVNGGDVFGPYKIDKGPSSCGDSLNSWMTQAINQAKKKHNMSGYDHIVLAMPELGCGPGGYGQIGKGPSDQVGDSWSWLHNWTGSTGSSVHELGHNLGLWHAATYDCFAAGAGRGGPRVSMQTNDTNCWEDTYGDPFDAMSCCNPRPRHFHTFNRYQLGQLSNNNVRQYSGAPMDFTVDSAAPPMPTWSQQLVMLTRGTNSFYPRLALEYRRPFGIFESFGYSDPVANGVSFRMVTNLETTPIADTEPRLLDMTPWTGTYSDAALPAGKSYWDWPVNRSYTVTSANGVAANVRISAGPPPGYTAVTMYGSVMVIASPPGKKDGIVIERNGSYMSATIVGSDIAPGRGCGFKTVGTVQCGPYSSISKVLVNSGDQGDLIYMVDDKPAEIDAGPGADIVNAGPGDGTIQVKDNEKDHVVCGLGNDAITQDGGDTTDNQCEVKR